jgi:hypothetical protein
VFSKLAEGDRPFFFRALFFQLFREILARVAMCQQIAELAASLDQRGTESLLDRVPVFVGKLA